MVVSPEMQYGLNIFRPYSSEINDWIVHTFVKQQDSPESWTESTEDVSMRVYFYLITAYYCHVCKVI